MSDQTVRITKERLAYLEYLEKNMSSIVTNAVFEIIEHEKPQKKKQIQSRETQVSTMCVLLTPLADSRGGRTN